MSIFTRRRAERGNMLVLITAVTAFIVLVLLLFVLNYTRFIFGQSENVNALEAASLSAVRELSRIVIEDDYYGLVSLSDYPPIGTDTSADDNQPLPVFGINTIIGTTRLDLIIANELNNPVMIELARRDVAKAREAATKLSAVLDQAVQGQGSHKDMDGKSVDVLQSARAAYQSNLDKNSKTGTAKIQSFSLSLGWIEGGASTITEVPKPSSKSYCPADKQQSGNYKAFVNIPVFGEDFYFAGLADRPSLVDAKKWRPADGVRVPSAVKAEATHVVTAAGSSNEGEIVGTACAIPAGNKDLYPPGQLNIGFPHGRVPGIVSIRSIFDDPDLKINPMPIFIPQGGDWPGPGTVIGSPTSVPGLGSFGPPYPVASAMSMGFYDWLRSSRTKPRVDAVIALVDMDLFSVPGANQVSPTYQTYTFTGCPNDPADPRFLALLNNSQSSKDGYLNMTTLGDIWSQLPANSTTLQGNANGGNISGGNPFTSGMLRDFWDGMALSNAKGWEAYNLAMSMNAAGGLTAQQQANVDTLLMHSKWVILASYHTIEQLTSITAQAPLQQNGPNFQFSDKLAFNNSWVAVVNGGLANEHDKVNFVTLAPTQAQVLAGSASMNSVPGSNNWFDTTDYASDTSHFFFMGGFNPSLIPSGPMSGMTVPSGPTAGGSTGPVGPNPNPPASLNEAIRLRVNNDGTVNIVYSLTPFGNIPVSESQIYGVALGAKTHGTDNPVTWTAILRDNVRVMGRTSGGSHAGQPPAGSPPDYINNPTFGGTPGTSNLTYSNPDFRLGGQLLNPQPRTNYMSGGLSVEFQFRNPLILKCNQNAGQTTNGNGQSSSVNPEIPADLL
ncbi:hypothetical protein GC174_07385 [bacterium]|nr:hypothetical protein [bacterium]